MEINKEMIEYFINRTNRHIELVQSNIYKLTAHFPELSSELLERANEHDLSKFTEDEFISYIKLTWSKVTNLELNIYEKKKIDESIRQHYFNNRHHPEHFLDISNMESIDILEMFADWLAISQEFHSSIFVFISNNVGSRWKFTSDQVNFLDNLTELY